MASNTILADIHELFSLVNMFVSTKIERDRTPGNPDIKVILFPLHKKTTDRAKKIKLAITGGAGNETPVPGFFHLDGNPVKRGQVDGSAATPFIVENDAGEIVLSNGQLLIDKINTKIEELFNHPDLTWEGQGNFQEKVWQKLQQGIVCGQAADEYVQRQGERRKRMETKRVKAAPRARPPRAEVPPRNLSKVISPSAILYLEVGQITRPSINVL